MARGRKKKRPQISGQAQDARTNGVSKTNPAERTPRSMVIRMGASDIGPSVTQLVMDMRTVMEPHTAARLKERRSNRLRDYTSMAGPLGVTHLLLFSRSASGNTNLRIAVTPRGPTFNFRVEKYSLCRDITKTQKRPKTAAGGVEHLTPPLLVMNNFTTTSSTATTSIPKHLEQLSTSVFQSLFPALSPQRTSLNSIRRVLLLNRDVANSGTSDGTYTLSLRHYAITTRPLVPLSRGLKRLRAATSSSHPSKPRASTPESVVSGTGTKSKSSVGTVPNLSRLDDVADYLLDPGAAGGYTSASDTDADTDAEVEVLEPGAQRLHGQRDRARNSSSAAANGEGGKRSARSEVGPQPQRRAVRLKELGPRMKLRLVKVEEGLCEGKVLWHEFVTKTRAEEAAQDAVWEARRAKREERRRVQRENVERKKREKGGDKKDGDGGDAEDDMEEDDDEWYDDFEDDEMMEDVRSEGGEGTTSVKD